MNGPTDAGRRERSAAVPLTRRVGRAMMTGPTARIRVEVARGPTPSERRVMFTAEERTYALLVDARDVAGNLLSVTVLHEQGDQVVIELPCLAIAARRVKVPRDSVLDEPASGWLGWVLLGFVLLVSGCGAWALVRWME